VLSDQQDRRDIVGVSQEEEDGSVAEYIAGIDVIQEGQNSTYREENCLIKIICSFAVR